MHVWRCPIPLEWDTAGTGRKMAFGGWECGFWPGKGQIDAGTPHPGDGTLWDMQGAMDSGQLTMDNAKRAADCRSTVYFPLSTLSAAGRPPPPLCGILFHSVAEEAGERGSRGAAETAILARSALALLPSWRSWRLGGSISRAPRRYEMRLGRAKFRLLQAKFELFGHFLSVFSTQLGGETAIFGWKRGCVGASSDAAFDATPEWTIG
jgi:hypothetical protein